MSNDGKNLESLVAFIEKLHLPPGFEIKTNRKVVNEDGVQIAEFDVEINGKVGTTEFAWLIECRDRPSAGSEPVSWIEQLVGRRNRFKFNKVTAVSTAGFSPAAIDFAKQEKIELRQVTSLSEEIFNNWFQGLCVITNHTHFHLDKMNLNFGEQSDIMKEAINKLMQETPGNEIHLIAKDGKKIAGHDAFRAAAGCAQDLLKDIVVNGEAKKVELVAQYPEHDCFSLETNMGVVPIKEIYFEGEVSIKISEINISALEFDKVQYSNLQDGQIISQTASTKFTSANLQHEVEMHKIAETGKIHFTMKMRKVT